MRRRQRAKSKRSRNIDVSTRAEMRAIGERWTPKRIEIVNRICGEGYVHVGGQSFIQRRIEPMELDEKMSALDLNAGLSGAARMMAR